MYFKILGPLEVEDEGCPVDLAGSMQRALLTALLLHANEVVSRDVLVDELWGERAPESAGHRLEAHVSRLRKTLHRNGATLIVTQPTGYSLQLDGNELDLAHFDRLVDAGRVALRAGNPERAATRLREALRLWRGRALEDVAFESFAQVEIDRLEERHAAAYERLFEAELACGRHGEIVDELGALIRRCPLREQFQAQLMLALYRSGRQAEALEVYQQARRSLVAELGLEPGPELQQLEQAILRHDAALRLQAPQKDRRAVAVAGHRPSRPALMAVALAAIALVGAGIAIVLGLRGSSSLSDVPPNAVGEVDPGSGRIIRAVPVGSHPIGLTVADGRVWVANLESRTISRIDPSAGRVVDVVSSGGTPTALAAGAGAVWVAEGFAGKLVRLDPKTGEVTSSVALGGHPSAVAVDWNGIWVTNSVLDAVQRVDPQTLEVRSIAVGSEPTALAVGGGSVWVVNGLERTLTRIDAATGTVSERRIPLRFAAAGIAYGDRSVWVTEPGARSVTRIDARTSQARATIGVGRGPAAALVVGADVWAANTNGASLTEIDAEDDSVVRSIALGSAPRALAFANRNIWIAATAP